MKNLLTFGLLFFAIGSVVGLVAIQYWMVIVGQIVQTAGASVIPAIAMIVPVRYFSLERRGRALVGQSFMQIAMSNTVSRTLSKEHIGVEMGLFSMVTFISSAASTAAIGKVLDSGTSTVRLNPIPQNITTFVYSNIFLILAVLVVVMAALYYVQFGRVAKMAKDEKMDSESVA
ncbi:MAG: hypothetical protein ACQEXV_19105 [Bacillota bacterium]